MSSGIRSNYSYDENDESLSASMDGVAALPTSQERHTVLDKLGDSAGSKPVEAAGDHKDELRLIRQFKQEKTIKIAILDRLDGILKEKIMMLRKEMNKDNK
jgi:hypothetical protein